MVYGFSNGPATQPIVHMDNLVHHDKTSTYTVARLSKRNSLASNYHWNLRIRSDHTFLLVYPWWYMEYSTRWVIAIHLWIIFFDVFVTSDIYSLRKHSSGIKNDHLRSLSHLQTKFIPPPPIWWMLKNVERLSFQTISWIPGVRGLECCRIT